MFDKDGGGSISVDEIREVLSVGQNLSDDIVNQIIKQVDGGGGKLEFGTEIVAAKDGTLAALLGASPGASTAANAMINVIERCFPEKIKTPEWQERMKELVPSYGHSLVEDEALLTEVRARTLSTLKLG